MESSIKDHFSELKHFKHQVPLKSGNLSPRYCLKRIRKRPISVMDLSDLVHGMKKKSPKKKEGPSKDHGSSSSVPPASSSSHQFSQKRHATSAGSSSSHAQDHYTERQGSSARDTSAHTSSPSQTGKSSSKIARSTSSQLLQCELCKRTFNSKSTFDQHTTVFHRRNKVPVKPREATFLCPHCGKGFTSPSKRNVHQNATHMGLRPFTCEVCNKSFGYKGDLTKHAATHTGIKAHSCYICGARFARNFYVKRHIETVHEKKGMRKK